MIDFRPFRGLRYQESRAGSLAGLLAPPYDVLSTAEVQDLFERSPYNVIRLEHPTAALAETSDPYTQAAALLQGWREAGILRRDEAPGYYVHEQHFSEHGEEKRRTVVYGRLRLSEWAEGQVLPHEYTMRGPKEDRLKLMQALSANISPLYLLYDDPDGHLGRLVGRAEEYGAVADVTADGERHALRHILDPVVVESIRIEFSRLRLYMADGHHRYETALAYRDLQRAEGREDADFVLVGLTAGQDPGLSIHATHRLFSGQLPADLKSRLSRDFAVADVSREALDRALSGDEVAIGFAQAGSLSILRPLDHSALIERISADAPDGWRSLDVNLLQRIVLGEAAGLDPGQSTQPGLSYVHSVDEALEAVEGGEATAAFLLRPVSTRDLFAVSDLGVRLPQKSTYFYPKLPTGLVLNPLD